MTLAEIIARMNQIDAEVRSCTDAAQIEALTTELTELQEKRAQLEAAAARREEARGIQNGSIASIVVGAGATAPAEERSYDASSPEYRRAFLKSIAVDRDGRHLLGDMTAEERAAFTFMTSNSSAVVPTETMNRIADRVEALAPIVADAERTNIENEFAIPCRTSIVQGDAKAVAEGTANDDEKDEFVLLSFPGFDISKNATLSRRMTFQSIDAFESWLVNDLGKRIAVAEEKGALARLDGVAPIAGATVIAETKINADNVLTGKSYSLASIREARSKIRGAGRKVVYANSTTIWMGFASINDESGKPSFIPTSMDDPTVQGVLYGAVVKEDPNLDDNVAYFGIEKALKANVFGPMEMLKSIEPKTLNRIYTGAEVFDAGLEDDKAFVKVTFTAG